MDEPCKHAIKRSSHKRSYSVKFLLYEVSRIGKSAETADGDCLGLWCPEDNGEDCCMCVGCGSEMIAGL